MLKYIPHKNNTHSWRTLLFIFFVTIISAGMAYFAIAYPAALQKNVATQEVDNIQAVQIPVTPAPSDFIVDDVVVPELITEKDVANPSENLVIEKEEKPLLLKIERNKNPANIIEEAKTYAQPQILTGKYIDISLKYQNMVIFEDGKALDAYQISSGMRGMGTPVGTFKIENKSPRAWSAGYGLWMPNWMAILPSGKIGIHELPVWPGGYQEGANHLGIPVSHGCVRLGVGAAKRVFDWAEIGTPVIVHQ
jgi:lipoprotein-anchoring transpeptidase ErfK/SrfK